MLPITLRRCAPRVLSLLSWLVLLNLMGSVRADPKPLSKDEQARVDRAIDKGIAFLKRAQKTDGEWTGTWSKSHPVGYTALPAYALLESGVLATDPVIRRAAEHIRPRAYSVDQTYDLALAILFLDRLGDPNDKKLIQTLSLRLIAGQHQTGGWSYRCPILGEESQRSLITSLEELSQRMRRRGETRGQALEQAEPPPALRSLTVFQHPRVLNWQEPPDSTEATVEATTRVCFTGRTDNSNSQFAMLGLWAAQRHGIPVEPSFEIMVQRFEAFQVYTTGAWGYANDLERNARSRHSMTCVGLLGLAIGRGLRLPTPGSPLASEKDVHVLKGMAALQRYVGTPSGQVRKPVPSHDLYFLWSLERVAVLYELETIGNKDWYRWGVESLVANQAKSGWWNEYIRAEAEYGPILSTGFALLFLKRSHPMKELTPKLPVTAKELNEQIARLRPEDKFPCHRGIVSGPSRNPEQRVTTPSESRRR